jgi:ABC-type dipeptide/oligopeptide/nickel transport system ATPase component
VVSLGTERSNTATELLKSTDTSCVGNSGSGKTTLAISILMCLGGKATCETRDRKAIHYINGPNVMYSGVVFDTAANIGTDHIVEPSLHLQAWRDMSPRPTTSLKISLKCNFRYKPQVE